MRLKTDMAMFRTPGSNVGKREGLEITSRFEPGLLQDKYIPVTRYANSLETGLYYKERTGNFCGTFYYVEPESDTFLFGSRIFVAETKYSAVYNLVKFSKDKELIFQAKRALAKYSREPFNRKWEEKKLKPDLMYTGTELHEMGAMENEIETPPLYSGQYLSLYGAEDWFDQILCLLAKKMNIELVVLTRMVGAKQIVQEVLDARSREDSFKSLVFT
jgi:hypothetical protein